MQKRTLKIWLKLNDLTPDPADFRGIVSSSPSVNHQDLLDDLTKEGIEIDINTVDSAVKRYFEKAVNRALMGHPVNILGVLNMRAVVKGALYGKQWDTDVNSIEISISSGTALRKEVANTAVEILGVMNDLIEIYSIFDTVTQFTDGRLTKGRNAEIKGSYIKIAGDHPNNGITFRNLATQNVTTLEMSDIVLNEPSRLMIFVPETLVAGEYELTITTQFSKGNKPLVTPRSATVGVPIIIS